MNIHETTIHATCPINGQWDYYHVTFQTDKFLKAEDFEHAADQVRGLRDTQERVAGVMAHAIPVSGTLTLSGSHTANSSTTVKTNVSRR